jgi:hypothetical protein
MHRAIGSKAIATNAATMYHDLTGMNDGRRSASIVALE